MVIGLGGDQPENAVLLFLFKDRCLVAAVF
jgi:hypothetical protein